MAYDVPSAMTEYILIGPEVAFIERVLAGALEQVGQSADDLAIDSDIEGLDPLPAAYVRWAQHTRSLESSAYALPVDGYGLLPVTVPTGDVPLLIMSLKSRAFDLGEQSAIDGGGYDQWEVEMIWGIIWRFEGRLW